MTIGEGIATCGGAIGVAIGAVGLYWGYVWACVQNNRIIAEAARDDIKLELRK